MNVQTLVQREFHRILEHWVQLEIQVFGLFGYRTITEVRQLAPVLCQHHGLPPGVSLFRERVYQKFFEQLPQDKDVAKAQTRL